MVVQLIHGHDDAGADVYDLIAGIDPTGPLGQEMQDDILGFGHLYRFIPYQYLVAQGIDMKFSCLQCRFSIKFLVFSSQALQAA